MNENPTRPSTLRAKVVYGIWRSAPRLVFVGMIVAGIVLGGLIKTEKQSIEARNASAVKPERPPVNVVELELKPLEIRDSINLPGSIEPWTRLDLKARINGTVDQVLVKEGDFVKEGTLLARVETDDYQIALDRARASYKQAVASYERDRAIYAKGMVPTAQIEARETTVQTAKADLADAELLLSRCSITAPMPGVIQRLDVKQGLLVSLGDPVAEILRIDRVKAVVGIPESDITPVRKLDTVDVTVQALDNVRVTGIRHFLSPAPDSAARLYRLELALDNSDQKILPGMFVRADVVKQVVRNAVVVPFYSVISRKMEHYVYVDDNGVARKKPVTLGIMEQWMVQITSGLESGQRLIIEGHRDVEDGQAIKAVKVMDKLGEKRL
ncbi:MAG: efflux RND transporter periplasmic adaptor subunit [Pseudomonadota bacterium]